MVGCCFLSGTETKARASNELRLLRFTYGMVDAGSTALACLKRLSSPLPLPRADRGSFRQ